MFTVTLLFSSVVFFIFLWRPIELSAVQQQSYVCIIYMEYKKQATEEKQKRKKGIQSLYASMHSVLCIHKKRTLDRLAGRVHVCRALIYKHIHNNINTLHKFCRRYAALYFVRTYAVFVWRALCHLFSLCVFLFICVCRACIRAQRCSTHTHNDRKLTTQNDNKPSYNHR